MLEVGADQFLAYITYGNIRSGSPPARVLNWGTPLLLGDIWAEWLQILLRYSR